jgi:hypothetical protein
MTRIIITPEYLVKTFAKHPLHLFLYILAPFAAETVERANECFDWSIQDFKSGPDQPGKQGAIEVMEHLKSAYGKLTELERARLRKGLPLAIAEHLKTRNSV